jgi:hypothetical protein
MAAEALAKEGCPDALRLSIAKEVFLGERYVGARSDLYAATYCSQRGKVAAPIACWVGRRPALPSASYGLASQRT